MKSNQKGRSMIEMLGVLAIVGVLSVGGIAGYSKAMRKVKAEKVTSQLHEVIITIRNLYVSQQNYEDLSASVLAKTNLIPHDMFDPDGTNSTLTNALGGEVILFVSKDIAGAPSAFEIYATGLDKDICLMMSTLDWGSDPSSGFEALYIGTETPDAPLLEDINLPTDSIPENGIFTPGMHDYSVPLDVPTAMKVCACSKSECVLGLKYT